MKTLNQELHELRRLKDDAEGAGRDKKERDAAFKQHMARCLQRMEIEEAESSRTRGYLYSMVEKVKGQIEDRKPYVRWALENDPAIVQFLDEWTTDLTASGMDAAGLREFESEFFEAIMGTSVVEYKEKTDIMNQQARAHVDDEKPLPPGLTFRPDPYISMRQS